MLAWLTANLANIVIILGIVLAVFFVIRGLIRDKKAGKSSCGCSCSECGACQACHAQNAHKKTV
jgi:hypothetical protein